jgi:hypothetical protein
VVKDRIAPLDHDTDFAYLRRAPRAVAELADPAGYRTQCSAERQCCTGQRMETLLAPMRLERPDL